MISGHLKWDFLLSVYLISMSLSNAQSNEGQNKSGLWSERSELKFLLYYKAQWVALGTSVAKVWLLTKVLQNFQCIQQKLLCGHFCPGCNTQPLLEYTVKMSLQAEVHQDIHFLYAQQKLEHGDFCLIYKTWLRLLTHLEKDEAWLMAMGLWSCEWNLCKEYSIH